MTTPTDPRRPAEAASEPLEARIAASIEHWKRNLLDLTKRNRALNFRPNPVSTVVIVDEQPAAVFRQLVQQGGRMKFLPAPEEEEKEIEKEDGDGGLALLDLAENTPPAPDGSPAQAAPALIDPANPASTPAPEPPPAGTPTIDLLDPAALPGSPAPELTAPTNPASTPAAEPAAPTLPHPHTPIPTATPTSPPDNALQTTAVPEKLDRSLRRIDEQARLSLEEQGVNTLFLALGMLRYTEAPGAQESFRAPLVLVPVALSRRSARAGYVVQATDDDPLVNPALAEYLRRFHNLSLPELPDTGSLDDDYDLDEFFRAAAAAVEGQPGWAVTPEIYLGLFSFQKFVMYKDLEANSQALRQHRLVRQLVGRSGGQIIGLPADVQALELDRDFPPEGSAQVVDADSSQLRCLAATAKGYDLVIEGPPGTGKSQTITNLIAQALAAGKSVLFVAEKMAALQVVYRRLVNAGLGEFCLELHSSKANKRAVMQELRASLDASLQRPSVPADPAGARLPAVRATLSDYARAVHDPHGALEISPYRAYGELGAVRAAPRLKYTGPTDTVTREQFEQAVRALTDLAAAASAIGRPAEHPWRDAGKTFYAPDDLETIRDLGQDLLRRLDALQPQAAAVAASLELPPIQSLLDIETAARIAGVLARSPGAPLAVLGNDAWNAPPPAALALIERGRALAQLKAELDQRFTPETLRYDHSADIAYAEQKSQGLAGLLSFLDGRYKALKRQWQTYRRPGYAPAMIQQAQDMKRIGVYQQMQRELAAAEPQAAQLFGALWAGEASDWDALAAYVRWVVEFRTLAVQHRLAGRALQVAAQRAPDVSPVAALREAGQAAQAVLGELVRAVGWPAGYLEAAPLAELAERVRALLEHLAWAPRWAGFESARQAAAQTLAAEALPPALQGEVPFADLAAAFRRAFWQKWLAGVVAAREPLRAFHTLTHEQRVREFRRLDERVLEENRASVVASLRERVQQRLRGEAAAKAMPFLRREMARQRGLSPLRKTMQQAEPAIRAIKPCFMMSPLTVAQLLDGTQPGFDVVIFDEASQLPAEDAMGAILRGQQLVVVGDPKQLPPTNFFSVMSGQVTAPVGEDGLPLYEDSESVLEEFMGSGAPVSRLKWHYRSTHESLIAFSNLSFYDADLYTFPSVETEADGRGVRFEFVADGLYEGQGLNLAEARRVADAVVEHARLHPDLTLGVGTFNLRQQLAIQDELERRRREDPSLEPFFAAKEEGTFFVKNLENIQGDERDVIFISVTYARGTDGRLRYNFGPLNMQNGWRRLNVLITRAKRQMRVFSSIRAEDFSQVAIAGSAGARLLHDFLRYAETGQLDAPTLARAAAVESPFERDVYRELTQRGVNLVPQVGVSGYRIDFGVLDPEVPGRYVCGLECDGVAYHSSPTARDRDRLRQQVLEARGWTIHRLWSTDWYKDREGQVERILALVEQSREETLEDLAAQRAGSQGTEVAHGQASPASLQPEEAQPAAAFDDAAEDDAPADYERPVVPAYRAAPGEGRYAGRELLDATAAQLNRAIAAVVKAEAPLHLDDLVARVASMWDTRAGSRIRTRILEAVALAARQGELRLRGEFVWGPDGACSVRSRAGTRIPPERIAPEEYRAAILLVLGTGHGFARPQLVNEVRALFGYGRATEPLQRAVEQQVERLLNEGRLGEGSAGLMLRG